MTTSPKHLKAAVVSNFNRTFGYTFDATCNSDTLAIMKQFASLRGCVELANDLEKLLAVPAGNTNGISHVPPSVPCGTEAGAAI